MNVMIVGGRGRLGQKLIEVIGRETEWGICSVVRTGIADPSGVHYFDTLSKRAWRSVLSEDRWRADVIINCAAITNVDYCEQNREEAWQTNVSLVEMLVDHVRINGGRFIQLSTDYVFDGDEGPYTEASIPNPVNYYGKTKLAAENVCIQSGIEYAIIRTMWLYGSCIDAQPSFVDWVLENVSQRKRIPVVTDEIGNPTLTDDLAYGIVRSTESGVGGILNMAGPDRISRCEFAMVIAAEWGFGSDVIEPILSDQLERAARRPLQSGLLSLAAESRLGISFTSVENGLKTYRVQTRRRME